MKRVYERPMMFAQEFMANEYVAACGDGGKVYNFVCDARGGSLYYYPDKDDKPDGIYNGSGSAQLIGTYNAYSPCGATHEASAADAFYDGYVQYTTFSFSVGLKTETLPVIVWRGTDGQNGHATTHLDMDSWTTAKS